MLVGIHGANRRWARPQLRDGEKELLRAMAPGPLLAWNEGRAGVRAAKLFSYDEVGVWDAYEEIVTPELWVVRFDHLDDAANLDQVYGAGFGRGWSGVRVFVEIFNEPNNPVEGFGGIEDFVRRYEAVEEMVRGRWGDWGVCFPGLSPSFEPEKWWGDARIGALVERADVLGLHAYYTRPELLYDLAEGASWMVGAGYFPEKRRMLTEFCCTAGEGALTDGQRINGWAGGSRRAPRPRSELAKEYAEYAGWLAGLGGEEEIDAVFFFLLGSDDYAWIDAGETFDMEMARALGAAVGGFGERIEGIGRSVEGVNGSSGEGHEEGGGEMEEDLRVKHAEAYAAWVEAGGVANNFRKHALGVGLEKATAEDLLFLADEAMASVRQLQGAVYRYVGREMDAGLAADGADVAVEEG